MMQIKQKGVRNIFQQQAALSADILQ